MTLKLFAPSVRSLRECNERSNKAGKQSWHSYIVPYIVPDTERRLLYLRVTIVAGTIASMALSHKLWLSSRFYPLTPVFPFLKPIPSPFDIHPVRRHSARARTLRDYARA